jgi:ketosteroid isomerase-like protein
MPEEPTTPDLVALVRQVLETFSSGDLDTMMSFYAPDAVVSPHGGLGDLEGEVQIRDFFEGERTRRSSSRSPTAPTPLARWEWQAWWSTHAPF